MKRLLACVLLCLIIVNTHGQTKIPPDYWLGTRSLTGNGYGLFLRDDKYIFITGETHEQPFLLKYTKQGKFLWSRSYSVNGSGRGVIADQLNNIFISGIEFDNRRPRAFIAKFWSDDGRIVWRKTIDGSGDEISTHIGIDRHGSVYVGGVTTDSIKAGIRHIGSSDLFVAKYNTEGRQLWIRQLGTSLDDMLDHMATDGDNIFLFGTSKIAKEYFEKFIHKLDHHGKTVWTKRFILKQNISVLGIAIDYKDQIYVIKPLTAKNEHYSNLQILRLKNSYSMENIPLLPKNIRVLEGLKFNWRNQLVHSNFPFRKDTYIFINTYRRNGRLVKHEIIDTPKKWDVVYDFSIYQNSFCLTGSSGDVLNSDVEQRKVLLACQYR